VAVERSTLAPLIAVISLLYVCVVRDYKGVLMLRARAVFCNGWRGIFHSLANFGHCILLQVVFVCLLCVDCFEFLSYLFV